MFNDSTFCEGGLNLGERLIKASRAALEKEYPSLHTFSTLSPIPGFKRWISSLLNQVYCV
jgi:malonyl-CoA decarboxylase